MNLTERIIACVEDHPGATTGQVAEMLQHQRASINPMMSQLAKKGRLTRTLLGHTPSNIAFYGYWPATAQLSNVQESVSCVQESAPKARKPRKAPNPSRTQTNATTLDLNTLVEDLATSLADTLAQQVAAKLKDRLMAQLATQLPALAAPPPQIHAPIINEPRASKPKVLIAGLLPQQAGMIQSEFGEVFDLAFWKDESLQALKHRAEAAQVTITFTSKIGHAAESAIKATSTEYHRCVGGMTSLRDKLTRMYVENDQTAH